MSVAERLSEEIVAEDFPKSVKNKNLQNQEPEQTQNRIKLREIHSKPHHH